MKLPLPPTGGQGGHYSSTAAKTRLYDNRKRKRERPARVPRRFRKLRLRRRRRSRVAGEHPLMTILIVALLAVPLGGIALAILQVVRLLLSS
ncbi:MAG: hypothetical protein QNJ90_15130 [Planctomycetota bacterium]|nr:hypothetical protein [Planctomycetota bacterium]